MKKEIIIGVCFTAIVLLIAPTIPAQEYIQIENAYENAIQQQFKEMKNDLFVDETLTDEQQQKRNEIISTLSTIQELVESSDEPTLVVSGLIINLMISLFFSLIGTVFGWVFGPLLSALVLILASPALLLAKIISFLLGENVEITG